MGPHISRCRCAWLLALFLLPAVARAADPVDQLRDALKIDPIADLELAAKRNKMIEAIIPDLKTIAQLRRAYFHEKWPVQFEKKPIPILDVDRYRQQIGEKLTTAIRSAAADADPDTLPAVAILIAELADKPIDTRGKEKFTRSLTDVALSLAKDKNLAVRQAGLHALGKITPDPAEALPIFKQTLQKDELGPRRLAAYALTNLVKNAHLLGREQKLKVLEGVLATAALALRDDDEPVRGYALQAIQASAQVIADRFTSVDDGLDQPGEAKKALKADLQRIFPAYQSINPQLLQALHDPKLNVRLAALKALDQIGNARSKMVNMLQEQAPDRPGRQGELLKEFGVPDPLGGIVSNPGKVVDLLQEDDARLRRGAMDLLEFLGDQAAPVVEDVTLALRDSDRLVRWSAARVLRNVPPQKVSAEAIRRLGTMLIDPDPDLSAAAAATLEALGPAARDAVDWLAFVIANGDTGARNWDAENRIAAMKALVAIGGASAQRAVPQLATAVRDEDVRVRREAAYTLGRLGRPADADLARQALSALRPALSDEDADVRLSASEAILSLAAPR